MYTIYWKILIILPLLYSYCLVNARLSEDQFPVAITTSQPSSSAAEEISQDYLRWSEWQRKRLLEALEKRKRITTPLPNVIYVHTGLSVSTTTESGKHNANVYEEQTQRRHTQPRNAVLDAQESFESTNLNSTSYAISNYTNPPLVYTLTQTVVFSILTTIASFITISGNILVLTSFFVERALRTTTNYLIASLAVTDLLIGIFSMNFYTFYLILGRWPLGRLSCDLWLSLDYTACLTSQYTVLIITIDRFFSVRTPAKYRNWRTDRKMAIMIAATWIIPSSIFFPVIMAWPYFQSSTPPRPKNMCYAEFANDPVFNTVFTVCYFWITSCFTSGLYVGIYRVAVNLQKRSDEKRNRVSGLMQNNVKQATTNALQSQLDEEVKTKMGGQNTKITVLQPSSSSMVGAGDSSGFDSDEERNQLMLKQNPKHQKGHISLKALRKKETTPLNATTNGQTNQTNGVNISIPKPKPVQEETTEKMVDKSAVFIIEREGLVDDTLPRNKLSASVNSSKCPIHGNVKKVDSSLINDSLLRSPSSVCEAPSEAIQISSPVLSDEDSGFEVNGTDAVLAVVNLYPISPALCLCSDVEEETDSERILTDSPEHVKPVKSSGSATPTNLNHTGITSKISVEPTVDDEYHRKVLENFNKRMALKNSNVNNSVGATRVTSSNSVFQEPNVKRDKENKSQVYNSKTVRKDMEIRPIKDTHHSDNLQQSNEVIVTQECIDPAENSDADTSPIWKPQPYILMHTFSAPCSIQGIPRTTNPMNFDGVDSQNECLIYSGQPESDTLQSSSSFVDYAGPVVIESNRHCETTNKPHNYRWTDLVRLQISRLASLIRSVDIVSHFHFLRSCKRPKKTKVQIERGKRENRARKALRTITIILGAFFLCWTPYHVVIIIKGICDDVAKKYTCVNEMFYSVTYWLCYMNSPINPFCYALANAQFKKTFLRILHGDFRRS